MSQVDRLLRGQAGRARFTLEREGTPVDPDSGGVTAHVLNSAGTVVVASTAATKDATGEYSLVLSPTVLAELDWLECRWTFTLDAFEQTRTTRVDVATDHYFTVAQARELEDLADDSEFPDVEIIDERLQAEEDLEQACRDTFLPRFRRDDIAANGGTTVWLSGSLPRRLRFVHVDGQAIDVASVRLVGRTVVRDGGWTAGTTVTVGYEHGWDSPPPRARRAAKLLAKRRLVNGPIDSRETQQVVNGGEGVIDIVVPGRGTTRFGIPEVDSFVRDFAIEEPTLLSVGLRSA